MNIESVDGRLSAAVGAFLADRAPELSPYSVAHLRGSLEPMTAALGNPPTADVTYSDLRAYVDGLYRRYKPGTIRPIVGDIRQFWRWAKKKKLAPRNAAKRLKSPSRRAVAATAEPKSAPEGDVRRVIEYLSGLVARVVYRDFFGNLCAAAGWEYLEIRALRDLFVIVLVYETGARIGEVQSLGSRAMDDALAGPGPAYSLVVTGKTGPQTLWFTTATAELWRLWQVMRPKGLEHLAIINWFLHCDPEPIRGRSTLSQMIARRCKEANVAPFRAHALRHAKAKRASAVVGLEAASKLLDHSSTNITAQYAAVHDDELSMAATLTGLGYRLWG